MLNDRDGGIWMSMMAQKDHIEDGRGRNVGNKYIGMIDMEEEVDTQDDNEGQQQPYYIRLPQQGVEKDTVSNGVIGTCEVIYGGVLYGGMVR